MCCFARPVRNVWSTQIFARLTGRTTQMLAYQMSYQSDQPNAMILPLPTAGTDEASLRFIDLQSYASLFDDLNLGYPYRRARGLGCSSETSALIGASKLVVHEVGDYVASFVPTIKDFDRLDPQFRLPEGTWGSIPAYANFGFAVFQLAPTGPSNGLSTGTTGADIAARPHPMAFEFVTATPQRLFFPTLHIHDGEVHERERFDHLLYGQHAGLDARVGGYRNTHVADRRTGLVRSESNASAFVDERRGSGLLVGDLLVHRQRLRGTLANRDTLWNAPGDPLDVPASPWRWAVPTTAAAAATAAGAWFLRRRGRLIGR